MQIKIISGGQTGVDQAALEAAKEIGFATGGVMPQGYRTLAGDRPEFAVLYDMTQSKEYTYPPRTEMNVVRSNTTLRIAQDFDSFGAKCTLKYIDKHHRPYHDVKADRHLNFKPGAGFVAGWIIENKFKVLNVAGNSETTCPGIQAAARMFLLQVFTLIKDFEEGKGLEQ